jgi:hypothetical protein
MGIPASAQPPVPESDDGYHFLEWLGTSNLAQYTEWWYFNVYDATNNVQAIFSYLVNNPANLAGGLFPVGISEMATVAYTPSEIVTEADVHLPRAFSAEYTAANMQLEGNAIHVIDSDTYQITGASEDGRIAWDRTYRRTAPSWYAGNRYNVASQPWELMSWLLYMPAATRRSPDAYRRWDCLQRECTRLSRPQLGGMGLNRIDVELGAVRPARVDIRFGRFSE